jgi:hypothetical protein
MAKNKGQKYEQWYAKHYTENYIKILDTRYSDISCWSNFFWLESSMGMG